MNATPPKRDFPRRSIRRLATDVADGSNEASAMPPTYRPMTFGQSFFVPSGYLVRNEGGPPYNDSCKPTHP